MSALAEALLAAQRQAIATLGKASVAGAIDEDDVIERLRKIGCNEAVDLAHILAAWDLLREFGAEAPTNGAAAKPDPATEPASEGQIKYLRDLADKKGYTAPDGPLTKARASEAIDALKAGTYNPDDYTAPF